MYLSNNKPLFDKRPLLAFPKLPKRWLTKIDQVKVLPNLEISRGNFHVSLLLIALSIWGFCPSPQVKNAMHALFDVETHMGAA